MAPWCNCWKFVRGKGLIDFLWWHNRRRDGWWGDLKISLSLSASQTDRPAVRTGLWRCSCGRIVVKLMPGVTKGRWIKHTVRSSCNLLWELNAIFLIGPHFYEETKVAKDCHALFLLWLWLRTIIPPETTSWWKSSDQNYCCEPNHDDFNWAQCS